MAFFERIPVFLELPGSPSIPWFTWKLLFQTHLEAAGGGQWTDARRASALISLLGREGQRKYFADAEQLEARQATGNAALALASPGETPALSKFDIVVQRLDRLFAASTNILVERHGFTGRTQLPGESFLDYVSALKEKAVKCRFGVSFDERVRDQIIHGITSPHVREKLLAYGEGLSLDKAEEIARNLEALHLANQSFSSAQAQRLQATRHGSQHGGRHGGS